MDCLFGWWAGLTAGNQFEIVKIVLDKGLLAFMIALAGYWFARRQENFKAYELRRLELEKITIPRVHALMVANDALWREAKNVIEWMDTAFVTQWLPWIDQVITHVSKPVDGMNSLRTDPKILDGRLQNGMTVREHLVALASDDGMKRRLMSVTPSGEVLFLTNLLNYYDDPSHVFFRNPRSLLVQSFQNDFFRDLIQQERKNFSQRVEDFIIEAKNVVPPHKKKPLEGVIAGANAIKDAVFLFPAGTKLLSVGFLAISSQLRETIKP